CPTTPFDTPFSVCGRECPTPCRSIYERSDNGFRRVRDFTYDDQRRWIATREDGQLERTCTYRGARLDTCIDGKVTWTFVHGPRHEILEAQGTPPDGIPLKYRYAGRDLVEIDDFDRYYKRWDFAAAFEYDDQHRLVRQRSTGPGFTAFRYAGARLVERDEQP